MFRTIQLIVFFTTLSSWNGLIAMFNGLWSTDDNEDSRDPPNAVSLYSNIHCFGSIDRLFVLSSTMAALSTVLRENLTYVYWIRYRTMRCGYASVPSEPHLPLVCVFKPMNLHSTYGEECWVYSIPSDLAHPRAIQLTIRSSAQNSKFHFLQNLIRFQHWASALHRNLKRLVLNGILYLGYLFQPLLHGS